MEERCSYCHDGTERENAAGQHEIGCPRRSCPKCGRQYFDAAYEEDALHAYHLKPTMPEIVRPLLGFLIIAAINIRLIPKMLQGLTMPWFALFSWGVASLFVTGRACVYLYPWVFRKRYYRKYEESKIPIFDGTEYISEEFSASLQRVSSQEYLYYLISHGVEVPAFFFHRIGREVDMARVEELKANRRELYERRARKERMKRLREELAYYEECLSIEPTSTEFALLAKAGGMSAGVFRTRCESQAALLRKELAEQEQTDG